MEQLLQRQTELQGRIARSFENLKKIGSANITKGAVQTRLDGLNENWKKFETHHEQLLGFLTKETATYDYFSKDVFGTTEEVYYTQKTRFVDLMSRYRESEKSSSSPSTAVSDTSSKTRLSHIELPHFSGSLQEWAHFKGLFTTLVLNDASLSNMERMHYLSNALSGEPANLIQGIPVTGENFAGAWQQLVSEYDNNRLLVKAQFDALSAIKPMRAESSQELKRVYHGTQNVITSLEALGRAINNGMDWLVHTTVERLSDESLRAWESFLGGSTDPPSYDQLKQFLAAQIRTLEAVETKTNRYQPKATSKQTSQPATKGARSHQVTKKELSKARCFLCQGNHYILFCEALIKRAPIERKEIITSRKLCFNCLGKHTLSECNSEKRCQKCLGKHHSILHDAFLNQPEVRTSHVVDLEKRRHNAVMLATAQVYVTTHLGERVLIRALIDPGSEVTLITENLVQCLRLRRKKSNMGLYGVGAEDLQRVRGEVKFTIVSRTNSRYCLPISALILRKLTNYQPHSDLSSTAWAHIQGLELADPYYYSQGGVDIILGVDVYCDIIQEGLRKGPRNAPIAQRTTLGWIISGRIDTSHRSVTAPTEKLTALHCGDNELVPLVQRFWKQEELPAAPIAPTADEQRCEEHYLATHRRNLDGRYVVRLPVRENLPQFSDSRAIATRLQLSLEKRFSRDEEFTRYYKDFMQEYEDLGHMEEINENYCEGAASQEYFLPHHGVWKENSITTKLRVVFNGSQLTSDGHSLNEFLFAGPNLLPDLFDVLLRWRRHKYVFSADIEKMYRQIMVDPRDRTLQQIIWRASPEEQLRTYQLRTVTYGLSCAPFLAIRTLRQLAIDEKHVYPLGSETLQSDCYVDDILSGDSSLKAAKQRQTEIIGLCRAGGFKLRKWAANCEELLPDSESNNTEDNQLHWPTKDNRTILGLIWKPKQDAFSYHVTVSKTPRMNTKRTVLSQIAKLFDPLGWIAPLTISAKIYLQSLWLLALGWDTPLPVAEQKRWEKLQGELPTISEISIPRWLHMGAEEKTIEIHGFADASEKAKAAVVYLRVVSKACHVTTSLIGSKTKVASLKPDCIARMELCAAKMLTELVAYIIKVLNLEGAPIHLWTDSKVTLAWIQGHPRKWTQYVANRVAIIQTTLPQASWHHIVGSDNPADCASRGMTPSQLVDFQLWWRGPTRLRETTEEWETSNCYEETQQEAKGIVNTVQLKAEPQLWSLLFRYSSLKKLLRITAWCQRWVKNCNGKDRELTPTLTTAELEQARIYWLGTIQQSSYQQDIKELRKGKGLSPKSRIGNLSPILDKDGLLRVGGRLKHSLLSYDEKHPIILPPDSYLTRLIIDETHRSSLHGGVQLMLSMIRRRYWIPRGRSTIKSWIHKCIKCIRMKAETTHQKMGDLPSTRVIPSRPFYHAGLDYAGPILLRTAPGRGHRAYKGYIAIFICFSTRSVHLEAVSNYTTAAFLAAFRRFVSRRGICSTLTSDCGSNFIGAAAELRLLFDSASKEQEQIAAALASDGTQWRFSPPAAPHFGGLWEAAVKSTKFHLKRVIGDTTLTYEEMSTFLAQVEACLNSRPLQPLTDDADDITALTPGHFLIGAPLCAIPEPSLIDVPSSRLNRWQLIQRMKQDFWLRWSQEYLKTLQAKGKWSSTRPSVKVGDLCIIKSETSPPTKWPLARIIEVHPGQDDLVRVVTLKTATSTLKRPVVKIIPIITQDE